MTKHYTLKILVEEKAYIDDMGNSVTKAEWKEVQSANFGSSNHPTNINEFILIPIKE